MPDMTEFEQQFFATGVLPPELIETAPAVVPTPVPTTQTEAPQQQVAPSEDMLEMLRRSLSEAQTRQAQAEAELNSLKTQQTQQTQQIAAPDPNTDPLGAMMHQLQQVTGNVTELKQQLTQQQQQDLLKQQFENFTNSLSQIKTEFEKTTPDFNNAYEHIRNIRMEDLRAVGVPETQIQRALLQDELNMAQVAIQKGRNPAEEIYKMSKRNGYSPKAQPVNSTQKLDNIAKGVAAAKQPARAAADTELTLESLKDAGDSDLSKMVQDDKMWAKLVGGTTNDI